MPVRSTPTMDGRFHGSNDQTSNRATPQLRMTPVASDIARVTPHILVSSKPEKNSLNHIENNTLSFQMQGEDFSHQEPPNLYDIPDEIKEKITPKSAVSHTLNKNWNLHVSCEIIKSKKKS